MPYGSMAGNAYGMYPATNQNGSYSQYTGQMPQQYGQQNAQSYAVQSMDAGMKWVDGEIGAKAEPFPPGWPPNRPYPMWDTNDRVIYFKSYNNLGMPNPLQKAHYVMDDAPQQNLMSGEQNNASMMSGTMPDMTAYVTKDDLNHMKEEILASLHSSSSRPAGRENGSSQARNGGDNR